MRVLFYAFVCLFLSCQHHVSAQKVDLDRFYYDVSFLKLPREYVEPTSRTFGVRVSLSSMIGNVVPPMTVYERINISGYQKTEAEPTVGITVNVGDLRFERSELSTRTEETKDRDGKVTGRTTYYRLTAKYSINGSYRLNGPEAGRQQEKAVARVEEKPKNRFLQNVVSTQPGDAPAANQVAAGFFPSELTFTSDEYKSSTAASQYFQENQSSIRNKLITDFIDGAVARTNELANRYYGYVPVQTRDFLWILDSKKHPEYPVQQEAIKAVKELMKGMRATESNESLAQNLQPLLGYFQELKTKYASDDKADKKMRYSAFFNLATLYYYLDQPDKMVEEANGLIKNDYDARDGEKLIELADDLKKSLDRHHMQQRHMRL